ncbi:3'-5' exonuclease [Candidatus Saccharibacteria bacterium]|nr:3'-5' exonuclease [Candidatus Saccharibacteria bacterium]
MKGFLKDILLIDFETTGIDLNKSLPIQLGAILLDRQTLAEKDNFLSYIKQDLSNMSRQSAKIHGITKKEMDTAPTSSEVIGSFIEQFGTEVYLASWNEMLDHSMLATMLGSIGKGIDTHDYHYLDIWSIVHIYMVQRGKGDIIRSEPINEYFGLPARTTHNALEDCKLTAQVLRKVYNR